jgi:hypothetical protein
MTKLHLVLVLLLVLMALVSCGGLTDRSADGTTTSSVGPSSGPVTTSSSETSSGGSVVSMDDRTTTTNAPEGDSSPVKSSEVVEPYQLLSPEEAAAISGFPVMADEGWLNKDPATGTVSDRYKYDLGGSTIHGLVEVHQDSLRDGDGTAKEDYQSMRALVKDEITEVEGLGEGAFTAGQGQLHMLHDGYYIVVAFDGDEYGTDEANAALNVKLGQKILENLKAKLG